MKKIANSISVIVAVAAIVTGVTTAFLSDTETSRGNTIAAGAVDLKIDNESYYNGVLNDGTSWNFGDLVDGENFFFFFNDLKPSDWGEDTISLHVDDNDAWACMEVAFTGNNDNGSTEPELNDENPYDGGPGNGELQDYIHFVWWADDGDNVLEDDEAGVEGENVVIENIISENPQFDVILADSSGDGVLSSGPLDGSKIYYIGKAWCFGDLTLDPVDQDNLGKTGQNGPTSSRGPGISCDGDDLDNTTQTDSVVGQVSFLAVQSRNNPAFTCEGGDVGCLEKADIMLVLDRSGSINSGELASLKNSAKAFVDAIAPTTDGAHMGQTSFSTLGSMDLHLTDDPTAVKAEIDSVVTGGFTNLMEGITLATEELDNDAGDGDAHDRDDATSPDFMIIITDGEPNEPGSNANAKAVAKAAADAAKAAGIEIYVVGVGTTATTATYLRDNIASGSDHYFDVADFDDLEAILENIAQCDGETG